MTGSVAHDGSFAGQAGNNYVSGKFSGSSFEGIYKTDVCGDRNFTVTRSRSGIRLATVIATREGAGLVCKALNLLGG